MYLTVVRSDQFDTWSDKQAEPAHCGFTETPQRSAAPTASAPSHPSRFSHRALQTMRQAGMQMRRRPRPWPQVLFVGQLSRLATADGLRTAGVLRADGRVPGQLPSSPRDPRGDLRDQPRTAAPTRGTLRGCHDSSDFCPPDADRCGIGRHPSGQYAGRLARQRFPGFAHRGGS
jgi:hypothetical protein